ncbi:FtsW/RodA/SpoVE family cell cycle protein [Paenibacillus sp. LjRoot56]|uniref:FtsW/RodA/SpoVE family cell cycle protein n=1 Tax=Paenibacillus sp. LjRoot56 TaxID=3342333 RepID=UPI003ECFFFE4
MSSFRHHEEITTFLKQVCREIKAKEVHSEVRLELESHLQELIEEKLSSGFDLDAAVKESISQMGTPDVIGHQFHLAHRPRFNWGLLAVVVALMGIGLVAIFSAQAANYRPYLNSLGKMQVMFFSVGSCLMLLISFSNYRKLAGYSWVLYIGTIMLLSYVLLSGDMMNGIRGYVRFGLIQLNIPALSPYLLLIALAGIWSKPQRTIANESSLRAFIRKSWINVGTVWLPSTLLLFTHSINNFVLFFIGCLSLLLVLRKKRALLAAHCSLLAAAFGLFVLKLSYQADRLYAYLHPNQDPLGMNYVLTQSKLAIQSAGWWGYGFGAPLSKLPALQSEMMFPFLIYCFGWWAGIALVMMVALFVQQTVNVSRKVKEPYGKAIVTALLAVFTTQYTWSMLMSIGLAPYSTFQLPFISYSGLLAILQFISIGLMLSVYRRKDLGSYLMT